MRTPHAAAAALLAGFAACSGPDRNPGQGALSSDTGGSAAAATSTSGADATMSGAPSLSEAEVRQSLGDHGYGNVANLHRSGDDWLGTATDSSGQPVNFDMNPSGILVIMP